MQIFPEYVIIVGKIPIKLKILLNTTFKSKILQEVTMLIFPDLFLMPLYAVATIYRNKLVCFLSA